MKKIVAVFLVSFLLITSSGAAVAASANFEQRILPLNCVFSIVNAGTGEIEYVTPKACGVLFNTPVINVSQTNTRQSLSQPSSTHYLNVYTSPEQESLAPVSNGSGSQIPSFLPLWRPIVSYKKSSPAVITTSDKSEFNSVAIVVILIAASLILIGLFIIFMV